MNSKKQLFNNSINYNFDLDFGIVLEKSFDNFKKISGIAGIGIIISSLFFGVLLVGIFGSIYGFAHFTETLTGFSANLTWSNQLLIIIFGSVFGGIFSPLNAGFIQMARNASTGDSFGLNTLFGFFSSTFFKDLFISSIVLSLFGGIVSFGFEQLNFKFIGNVISVSVTVLTIFTIPLIIFNKLDAINAITTSCKLVLKSPFIIFGLLFVALIICLLGIFGLCIGLFFTFPFWFSISYIMYAEIVPVTNFDALDEIGLE